MQLVLQPVLDLLFQLFGNIVAVGDVANPRQRLAALKFTAVGGQPGMNLAQYPFVLWRRDGLQLVFDRECRAGVMVGTEMASVFLAADFPGSQKA